MGIITPVEIGELVEWCTRMVTVPKKNGSLRITADLQELNKFVKRETHHTMHPFKVISSVPRFCYKSIADAVNGYHQVKLDADSSKLTTFITEFGRFRYLRTPQGLCSSGDAYTRRFDEILVDMPRIFKVIDDCLLFDFDSPAFSLAFAKKPIGLLVHHNFRSCKAYKGSRS